MFAGFLSPKQDPRSLKVEAARVRTILSEKRIAEILYEAFDEILIDGIADARVLLVHVDETGGHERAHVVGDRPMRSARSCPQRDSFLMSLMISSLRLSEIAFSLSQRYYETF